LKMIDCRVPKLLSRKGVTKINLDKCRTKVVMALSILGSYIERPLKLRNSFVYFSSAQKNEAEVIVSNVILTSNSKRMVPERLAIFPIGGLTKSAHAQRHDCRCSDNTD